MSRLSPNIVMLRNGPQLVVSNMPNEIRPEVLIATEVAGWLRVKPATIYAWAAMGTIPSVKLNGTVRFVRADVQEWLETRSKSPDNSHPSPSRTSVLPIPAAVSRPTIQRAAARALRRKDTR